MLGLWKRKMRISDDLSPALGWRLWSHLMDCGCLDGPKHAGWTAFGQTFDGSARMDEVMTVMSKVLKEIPPIKNRVTPDCIA